MAYLHYTHPEELLDCLPNPEEEHAHTRRVLTGLRRNTSGASAAARNNAPREFDAALTCVRLPPADGCGS